jgi:hypothetical protein
LEDGTLQKCLADSGKLESWLPGPGRCLFPLAQRCLSAGEFFVGELLIGRGQWNRSALRPLVYRFAFDLSRQNRRSGGIVRKNAIWNGHS